MNEKSGHEERYFLWEDQGNPLVYRVTAKNIFYRLASESHWWLSACNSLEELQQDAKSVNATLTEIDSYDELMKYQL